MMVEWLQKLLGNKPKQYAETAYWLQYKQAGKQPVSLSTPLPDVDFVVFDTETTGFDKNKDRVVSIGAVRVKDGQVLVAESFECLIRQQVEQGNKSAEIHGLLPSEIRQGMDEEEALALFLGFIGNAVLVAHHIGFDIGMIKQMLKRQNLPERLHNQLVDTGRLALRLEHPFRTPHPYRHSDYSLDSLGKRYHLPLEDRHTASGDAFATAVLLLKLLAIARKKDVKTLGDLLQEL
ncbi:3'-5' exonuclease [Pontibacter beigongshangensis]|uniref:3'-5' exonuclease n=1 Tax=Pontibacter beigongshangensis TaxID=2574733 RepID=UPI001F509E17|nr:3'-5' exonuclease [Pontibacter beigongshangensis]